MSRTRIDQDRRQPRPHPPSFPCVIPNCVTTREPAAPRLSFLFSSSCFLSLSPRPRSPLPSPLPSPILALTARPRLHHSSLPSPSAITTVSSRQRADVRRQHTSIYASLGPHPRVLESSGSRPLSLPLLSPGEHPRTRHAGTVLHYIWHDKFIFLLNP